MAEGYDIGLWLLLILASITDLIWGKIFNWFNLAFAAAGLLFGFWIGGVSAVTNAGIAILVAFVLFYPFYLMKAMAAGDVKLLMAVGAWSNAALVLRMGMISILFGAFVGLIVLLYHKGFKASVKSVGEHLRPNDAAKKNGHRMPFAPAFLCAYFYLEIAEKFHWFVI